MLPVAGSYLLAVLIIMDSLEADFNTANWSFWHRDWKPGSLLVNSMMSLTVVRVVWVIWTKVLSSTSAALLTRLSIWSSRSTLGCSSSAWDWTNSGSVQSQHGRPRSHVQRRQIQARLLGKVRLLLYFLSIYVDGITIIKKHITYRYYVLNIVDSE